MRVVSGLMISATYAESLSFEWLPEGPCGSLKAPVAHQKRICHSGLMRLGLGAWVEVVNGLRAEPSPKGTIFITTLWSWGSKWKN